MVRAAAPSPDRASVSARSGDAIAIVARKGEVEAGRGGTRTGCGLDPTKPAAETTAINPMVAMERCACLGLLGRKGVVAASKLGMQRGQKPR